MLLAPGCTGRPTEDDPASEVSSAEGKTSTPGLAHGNCGGVLGVLGRGRPQGAGSGKALRGRDTSLRGKPSQWHRERHRAGYWLSGPSNEAGRTGVSSPPPAARRPARGHRGPSQACASRRLLGSCRLSTRVAGSPEPSASSREVALPVAVLRACLWPVKPKSEKLVFWCEVNERL